MSGATSEPRLTLDLDALTFDARGLIPVVVQDWATGAVLMVAWANREALESTLETRRAHFYSRSRQTLWRKGETSGNELVVESLQADCDADTLLCRARPLGPTCHLGTTTCFDRNPAALELGWLAEVLGRRASQSAETSYTARLLERGTARVAQKVGEEATETVIAAMTPGDAGENELLEESADLLYHLLVLWQSRGISPRRVAEVLRQRHDAAPAAGTDA